MELIERPNEKAVHYLNSIPFETFRDDCFHDASLRGEKKPSMKDIKTWYSILKQFCKTNIKTKFITKRIYSHSLSTPKGGGGRLFSGGSMQGIWGVYRGLLMRGQGTDIDMKNCHPVILKYVCKLHNIPCPQLTHYIENRDKCLSEFESKNIGKVAYLVATNSDKRLRNPEYPKMFKLYDAEMKDIQKELVELPQYKQLFETIPEYRASKNFNGCAINRILCFYENIILQHAIHIINKRGLEIAILMFDGLMIYGNHYSDSSLLTEIEEYVETQMPGLSMKWTYKPLDDSMQIPEDFELDSIAICDVQPYDTLKKDFEKTHAKITKLGSFVALINDEIVSMSKQHLTTSYEHMHFSKIDNNGDAKFHSFIKAWITDSHMRICRDIGNYPKDYLCPPDIFNIWRPFQMEQIEKWIHREDELQFFLNHILVICGNEKPVADYFISWIAHMIQFPEQKSICPVLISEEGAGKGTLFRLIARMFGSKKVFSTQDPCNHVWGQFNGEMENAFLVNLDELSKKDTIEAEGKIKGLITEPTMMINKKGVKAYPITSYHRFIITTNGEEPINTSKDDRRKLIIRSSDELCKNKEYFNTANDYLEDDNVIKTCYEYFKGLKNIDQFNKLPMPVTEYQQELKAESRCPIERWVEDLAVSNAKEESIELDSVGMLNNFKGWCSDNHEKYSVNSLKLAVRLQRKNINGISKRKSHGFMITVFEPALINKHFNNGCLVDLEEG